jgi:hypothetical protein
MSDRVLDVYGVTLHLATTKAEWRRLRAQHAPLEALGQVEGLTAFWGDGQGSHVAFYVDRRLDSGRMLEVVAHEACHGAGMILDHHNTPYDGQTEALALLVGWLTRWLWESTP